VCLTVSLSVSPQCIPSHVFPLFLQLPLRLSAGGLLDKSAMQLKNVGFSYDGASGVPLFKGEANQPIRIPHTHVYILLSLQLGWKWWGSIG
jgi:hypothetical protein